MESDLKELSESELVNALIETAILHVLATEKPEKIADARHSILNQLLNDDIRATFLANEKAYVFAAQFELLHGERCLIVEHHWKGVVAAVEQMQRIGVESFRAVEIASNAPILVGKQPSREEFQISMSLLAIAKTKEPEIPAKRVDDINADLSVSQVAKLLQISRTSVIGLISSGKLNGYSAAAPGAKRASWRVTKESLELFRQSKKAARKESAKQPTRRRRRLPVVEKFV